MEKREGVRDWGRTLEFCGTIVGVILIMCGVVVVGVNYNIAVLCFTVAFFLLWVSIILLAKSWQQRGSKKRFMGSLIVVFLLLSTISFSTVTPVSAVPTHRIILPFWTGWESGQASGRTNSVDWFYYYGHLFSNGFGVSAGVTKEYDEVFATKADLVPRYGDYANGTVYYSFKVKLVVETEQDKTWIVGNKYDLCIFVTATYIDFDAFSQFEVLEMGNATVVGKRDKYKPWEEVVPEAGSTIQLDGFKLILGVKQISVSITWYPKTYLLQYYQIQPTEVRRLDLYPRIMVSHPIEYYNGFPTLCWQAKEPLYVTVRSGFDPTPYLFTTLGLVIALIVCGIWYKKREARKNQW